MGTTSVQSSGHGAERVARGYAATNLLALNQTQTP